jgi:curved DNA-binding protein CbpA
LTLKHHPDRNKSNPNFDPIVYKNICKAYAILKDPMKKQVYDTKYSRQFQDLREASRDIDTYQIEKDRLLSTKETFSEGDLDAFNKAFEKRRTISAHDIGYGDKMVNRISASDVQGGKRRDNIQVENVFGGKTQVDNRTFNEMFAKKAKVSSTTRAMIERNGPPEDLMSCLGGGCGSGFEQISVYDGKIVGSEHSDFSKYGTDGGGLMYADYLSGFENHIAAASAAHPTKLEDGVINSDRASQLYSEKMAERSIPDFSEETSGTLSKGEQQMRFQIASEQMDNEFMRRLEEEKERNRDIVAKYSNQYVGSFLPSAPSRSQSMPPERVSQTSNRETGAFDIRRGIETRGGSRGAELPAQRNFSDFMSNRMTYRQ